MTKITKLRSGNREVSQLVMTTQLRQGSTGRSGNLPKITQLKCGSIGKSGNVPKIKQF